MLGRTEVQREERIKYCIENCRFLMVVEEQKLASQALALSEARIGVDGEKLCGHGFFAGGDFTRLRALRILSLSSPIIWTVDELK